MGQKINYSMIFGISDLVLLVKNTYFYPKSFEENLKHKTQRAIIQNVNNFSSE